jgi:hypothetical protein
MLQWEYREIQLSDLPRRTNEIDLLNDAGKNGWELVTIATNNVARLKRRVAMPTATPTRSSPGIPTGENELQTDS